MKESKVFSIAFFLVALLVTIFTLYQQYKGNRSKSELSAQIFLEKSLSLPTNAPLVYISTREGLTSRYRQLEIIYSNARMFNRNLTVINMPSVHYKHLGPINLCRLFVLPASIKCVTASAEHTTHTLNCTQPYAPETADSRWLYKPHNFDLRSFDHMQPASSFSWGNTTCALLWGFYFELQTAHSFPVRFQTKFERLVQRGVRHLRLTSSITSPRPKADDSQIHSQLNVTRRNMTVELTEVNTNNDEADKFTRPIWVFHWRRGDQADRCRRKEDSSVNCLPVAALIEVIRDTVANYTTATTVNTNTHTNTDQTATATNKPIDIKSNRTGGLIQQSTQPHLNSESPVLVYVATNENDSAALAALQSAGFKIFSDLGLSHQSIPSTLDRFMVEVQMMIRADRFFGWGSSGVQTFVQRARAERGL